MKIKLIKSVKKDLPVIAKVYRTEMSKPPYNENWSFKKALDKVKSMNESFELFTIFYNKNIVGLIALNPKTFGPGTTIFIEEFAIKKEFQNKGVGTTLLKNSFKEYKKKGRKSFVTIINNYPKIQNFYRKLGFKNSKRYLLIEKKLK